jgi:hypothetical protein
LTFSVLSIFAGKIPHIKKRHLRGCNKIETRGGRYLPYSLETRTFVFRGRKQHRKGDSRSSPPPPFAEKAWRRWRLIPSRTSRLVFGSTSPTFTLFDPVVVYVRCRRRVQPLRRGDAAYHIYSRARRYRLTGFGRPKRTNCYGLCASPFWVSLTPAGTHVSVWLTPSVQEALASLPDKLRKAKNGTFYAGT